MIVVVENDTSIEITLDSSEIVVEVSTTGTPGPQGPQGPAGDSTPDELVTYALIFG